ncbi:MAG: 3-oxoacid CoA-transferase [Intestinimonas massiliensis]|uniref:acyl CoA:acetate/3-ketoacid CoA transferase n=1 Tax=Intestinimonas TaxID=1392389 RepID=UPI00242DEB16|nr:MULTISPECIES: CoA-transferase [Intestinimonas]MCI5562093.1 3-oxoacid CoA-transferase [Intestinimonas massiliensis (ex Afouda et al. 2020)]MDY5340127.1 CoA-transferase [Intestinimonas sp.]
MGKKPVITAAEAAKMVQDGMTFTTSGFVASAMPEALNKALEQRFLESGSPKDLTLFYAAAQGNRDGSGADHFAHEGMLKRVIGGHYNMVPELGKLINADKLEAYNLPQGTLSQLYRDIAGHKVGHITHVGLNTFADPRIEGGKLNRVTTEDIVEVVEVLGEERLLYKALKFDIGFIRGSYADENGNVTLEHECCTLEATSIAQAVKNSGGKVVVQVEKVVQHGDLDPKLVKIPGIYVDAIVVCENKEDHAQCQGCEYDGAMTGDFHVPLGSLEYPPMSAKKIIGRRAAMELQPDKVVNLGIGIPEYISMVANEEGIGDYMTLTVEAGPVGGVPQGGPKFGGSVNVEAILDQPYQFDFYDGGGVDLAFLGLAQADKDGNINVSKFGPRIAGCGGFVNITQNAKKVFFCGTFTAGGIKTHVEDGKLVIDQEGREQKMIDTVEQITFSGAYANKTGQPVMYITERAVFELRSDGVYLTEVAPGIDVQKQVVDQMGFTPKMEAGGPRLMDARIFAEGLMGLK